MTNGRIEHLVRRSKPRAGTCFEHGYRLGSRKIPAPPDLPDERSSDFSAVVVVLTTPPSDKIPCSSLLEESEGCEVLGEPSRSHYLQMIFPPGSPIILVETLLFLCLALSVLNLLYRHHMLGSLAASLDRICF